jgi:hypothetical protein
MRENLPNKNSPGTVIDLDNQAEIVALDIENRKPVHRIRGRKRLAHVVQGSPRRPFRNAVPDVQWGNQLRMPAGCFQQPLSRDDVQTGAPITNLFAFCEFVDTVFAEGRS